MGETLILGRVLGYTADPFAEGPGAARIDEAVLIRDGLIAEVGGRELRARHPSAEVVDHGDALVSAGRSAGEPLWRMPLVPDYEEYLASPVADADNGPRHAGAISAALFLQHFVGDVPWAHLDIASVGDAPDDRHEWTKGPTGFGVRLLLRWLTSADPLGGIS